MPAGQPRSKFASLQPPEPLPPTEPMLPDYSPRIPEGAPKDFYRLWTINDVARLLHVHPMTLRSIISRGEIKTVRVGSSLRFRPEHLAEYLDANIENG